MAGGPPGQARHPETTRFPPSLPADDKLEQQHSLFTRYKDPCRLGPGEEKPWAIGELGLGLGLGWGRGGRVSGDREAWGRGEALLRPEHPVLRLDIPPRLGSPQASQKDLQDLPQDPTAGRSFSCPGQQSPRPPLLPQRGSPSRGWRGPTCSDLSHCLILRYLAGHRWPLR